MRTSRRNTLSARKIKRLTELKKIISGLKRNGKKIVFTNGCFDILHSGHVQYLEKAKAKGDILIVAVNTDESIRKIKGENRPIVNQTDRIKVLAALSCVDYVTLFNQSTPLSAIQTLKPDVLIKGADWSKEKIVGADFVSGYGGHVARIKLLKGRSTTSIINKIAAIYTFAAKKLRPKAHG